MMGEGSQKYPFVGSDRIIYAMDGVFKYMLHSVLEYQGRLDPLILRHAIDYALAKSPILKSIARLRPLGAYWEVIDDLSPYPILTVKNIDSGPGTEEATAALLESYVNQAIDIKRAPPIGFLLVTLPGNRCMFVIKVHHCVADPVAMMYCVEDIQEAYGRMLNNEVLPTPGPMEDRSRKRLIRRVSPLLWVRVMWSAAARAVRNPRSKQRCYLQFAPSDPSETIAYRFLEYTGQEFNVFRKRCKSFGVTANELVIAALCRAIRQWNGDHERTDGVYSIVMPVDLRWYARKKGKVPRIMASFIGGSWLNVAVAKVTSFESAVAHVTEDTRFIKDRHLGLLANLGFPLLDVISPEWLRRKAKRKYRESPKKVVPTAVFAYLGKMDRTLPGFPGCKLERIVGIGAGFYPVGLDVVVMNFERTFHITVTYLKDACTPSEMDRFMELFSQEILGGGAEH